MTALLLSPHNDDETLFASFLCLKHRPLIVTVLRSVVQAENGIAAATREAEQRAAAAELGCEVEQWTFPDADPDWDVIRAAVAVHAAGQGYDRVFAPAWEKAGHDHHNAVSAIARDVFGDRVTYYTTYRYAGPRSTGTEVVPEPAWILAKLRALACYESQILKGPRRFFLDSLREWTKP